MPATRRHVSPSSPPPDPERHAPGERLPLAERQASQLEMKSLAVDLDELYSEDGLFAVICQRRNGQFTFAIFKGFRRMGSDKDERTSYIPAEMGTSYVTLAKLALERIDTIRKSGKAPFQERR